MSDEAPVMGLLRKINAIAWWNPNKLLAQSILLYVQQPHGQLIRRPDGSAVQNPHQLHILHRNIQPDVNLLIYGLQVPKQDPSQLICGLQGRLSEQHNEETRKWPVHDTVYSGKNVKIPTQKHGCGPTRILPDQKDLCTGLSTRECNQKIKFENTTENKKIHARPMSPRPEKEKCGGIVPKGPKPPGGPNDGQGN